MVGVFGGWVVVEYWVDDGVGVVGWVVYYVVVGGGGWVEEGSDVGF